MADYANIVQLDICCYYGYSKDAAVIAMHANV